MRFLDVKTAYAFKKVFGSENSKDILLSFLNAVIDFEGHLIDDPKILDPRHIPRVYGMKDSYVDVKVRLDNEVHLTIEMQVLNNEGQEQRILCNAAKTYSTQIVLRGQYCSLTPVVALTLTNFVMFHDIPDVRSEYRMKEVNSHRGYDGDLRLVFYELPKFTKTVEDLNTPREKWLYFISEVGNLEFKPTTLTKIPEIEKAFDILNESGMSLDELEIQRKQVEFNMIQRESLKKARKDGYAEGYAKGYAEIKGKIKERTKIIQYMNKAGITTHEIARITGLSEDEINDVLLNEL